MAAQVTLTFTDNSNREEGFQIERRTGAGPYAQIAQIGASYPPEPHPVVYIDTTVAYATTYTYRVRAFNAGGESGYSNEATVMTPSSPSHYVDVALADSPLLFYRFQGTGDASVLVDIGSKNYPLAAFDGVP